MPATTKILMGQIYTHLRSVNIAEYIVSDQFSLFLKNRVLEDTWKQYLVESQGRPDLYGTDVGKNAFISFLLHVFHSRHEEFLSILGDLFCSISKGSLCLLPIDELKRDLNDLGYPDTETDMIFLC
jgi:hypothetical protein